MGLLRQDTRARTVRGVALLTLGVQLVRTLRGHTGKVRALAMTHTRVLFTGGVDRKIIQWTLDATTVNPRSAL